MSASAIDIIEIVNDQNALLFKISITVSITADKESIFEYYAAMSEDRFWIRRNDLGDRDDGGRIRNITGIEEPPLSNNYFIFRIDTTNTKNIDTEIKRLSLNRNILEKSKGFLIVDNDIIDLHYGYILDFFTGSKYQHKQRSFNINLLFLIFLDKLIELSVDDTMQSKNCLKKLQVITASPLGNFLIHRMLFYKYSRMFYTDLIRVWEQSVMVNMAFHKFYYLLIENSLEKNYEPNYIAYHYTFWFDQPENDLNCFLKFTRDSGFTFNE